MTQLPLPRLELPPDVLLLHEEVAAVPFERRGNKRFAILSNGDFLHQSNPGDWDPPEGAAPDDPAAYWAGPLAPPPLATLTPDELAKLVDAIDEANIPEIPAASPEDLAQPRDTNPVLERWTVQRAGTVTGLTHHRGHGPKKVARLRRTVDELVGAALDRR
jgi:hypothetical protein